MITSTKQKPLKSKTNTSVLWQQLCLRDDLKAFEALFYALNNRLVKFCVLYIHNKEAAEEIVSDVFVKCWENRSNLAGIENPETYLFVAVKNQSLNYLKKFSHIHVVPVDSSDSVQLINTYDPEKELERKELHFMLDQAIATLPKQACIIFKLIKEDGMKYKEVAEILNISPRTVQTQLFRAIKKLSLIVSAQSATSKSAGNSPANSPLIGL